MERRLKDLMKSTICNDEPWQAFAYEVYDGWGNFLTAYETREQAQERVDTRNNMQMMAMITKRGLFVSEGTICTILDELDEARTLIVCFEGVRFQITRECYDLVYKYRGKIYG